MSVAENIRKHRKAKGLTQKQLGELCNPKIGESTIRKYELGLLNPKIETLKKIASALQMYLFEFIDDEYFDIATDEEPRSEENETKFFDEKREAIRDILQNNELTAKEKNALLHDFLLQTEIVADMHFENAKRTAMYFFEMTYDSLNNEGQQKAFELLEMLSKIPEFQKENNPDY